MISASVRRFSTVCAVVLLAGPLAAQGVQAPSLTVHTIWGAGEFASDLVDVAWMKDGKSYTTLDDDASGNADLYRVDALTGKKDLLVRGAELVPPGARVAPQHQGHVLRLGPRREAARAGEREARLSDVRQVLPRRAVGRLRP